MKRWMVVALAGVLVVALASCLETVGPGSAVTLRVTDAVLDTANFQNTGELTLGLVAAYPNGQLINPSDLTVTATLSDGTPVTLESISSAAPDPRALAAGIDLDDSRSLLGTDPSRQRALASQLFWQTIFKDLPTSSVALLDFSSRPPSPGFQVTRIIHDWSSSDADLSSSLDQVQPWTASGSPLYQSLLETIAWTNQSKPSATNRRVLVVMTDGLPAQTDLAYRQQAVAAARQSGIVIHTVGLGTASELNPYADSAAISVVRELASATGGIYAAVPDATGLQPVFRTLAEVTVKGQLKALFKLDPVPPSGTTVIITLTLKTSDGRTTTSTYRFVVP